VSSDWTLTEPDSDIVVGIMLDHLEHHTGYYKDRGLDGFLGFLDQFDTGRYSDRLERLKEIAQAGGHPGR
jgi:hypothetical protein